MGEAREELSLELVESFVPPEDIPLELSELFSRGVLGLPILSYSEREFDLLSPVEVLRVTSFLKW